MSVPVFDHPYGEEMFASAQSECPLVQVCAVSMHPVIHYQGLIVPGF